MSLLWRTAIYWVILGAVFVLLEFNVTLPDLVAAAIFATFATAGAMLIQRHAETHFAVPAGWSKAIRPLPAKLVTDTGRVFVALVRRLFLGDPMLGGILRRPFRVAEQKERLEGREAVTLFAISFTPNTVAITTDLYGGEVVVHQLEAAPEQTQPRDPEWPV